MSLSVVLKTGLVPRNGITIIITFYFETISNSGEKLHEQYQECFFALSHLKVSYSYDIPWPLALYQVFPISKAVFLYAYICPNQESDTDILLLSQTLFWYHQMCQQCPLEKKNPVQNHTLHLAFSLCSLFQFETVPLSFLDFNDLESFEHHKLVINSCLVERPSVGFVSCFLTIRFRLCLDRNLAEVMLHFSHCILLRRLRFDLSHVLGHP